MKAHNSLTLHRRIVETLAVPLVLAMMPLVAGAAEVLDREISFDIAPAPLATALVKFSQQSGLQVAAADPDISRLHCAGVTGIHPIRDALRTLLRGTGMGFTPVGSDTLAIRPEATTSAVIGNPADGSGSNTPASPAGTTPSSTAPPSVTITAPKPPQSQELAGDSVPKFIAAHAIPVKNTKQYARWHDRICPATSGLSPEYDAFVSARLREVAVTIGAPVQPAGDCKPNIEIVFTTDLRQLMNAIHTRIPGIARLNRAQLEKRIEYSQPIQAWNVIRPLAESVAASAGEGMFEGGSRLENSRLPTHDNMEIVATVIVADQTRLGGYSIGAIADYIAMLSLSRTQTRPDCSALPSILDLLSQNCGQRQAPTAITAGDIAFLRALYSSNPLKPMPLAAGQILEIMRRQLTTH